MWNQQEPDRWELIRTRTLKGEYVFLQSRARSQKKPSGRKRTRGEGTKKEIVNTLAKASMLPQREYIVFLLRAISSASYILRAVGRDERQSGSHVDNGVRRVWRCFFFSVFPRRIKLRIACRLLHVHANRFFWRNRNHISANAVAEGTLMAEWKASSNVNDISPCSFPVGRNERLVFPLQNYSINALIRASKCWLTAAGSRTILHSRYMDHAARERERERERDRPR